MDWEESGAPKGDGTPAKPAKKKRGKKGLIAVLVVLLVCILGAGMCSGGSKSGNKSTGDPEKLSWPKSGLATMLPKPPSEYGTANNFNDSIWATFEKISYDDYGAYVSDCKDLGFTENVTEGNTAYEAENADGYFLSIWFSTDTMSVTLTVPSNSAKNATTETPVAEEAVVEDTAEEEPADVSDDSAASSTSSVREVMDEYEAFMDEYIAFMTKYKESSNPVSMAVDYAKMMKRYSDMTKKFDALEDDSMSDEDLAYYLEVQARVTQKLTDASVS